MSGVQAPSIDFDAFIFDLDGTLLDTADDLGGALNRVLADANVAPVAEHVYRPAASNGANALLEVGFAINGLNLNSSPCASSFLTTTPKILLYTVNVSMA